MTSRSATRTRKGTRAIIGVDVGATSTSAGLVTPAGEILSAVERPTRERGVGTALDQLLWMITSVQAEARDRAIDVAGVGVGLPGIVDVHKGVMVGDVYLVPELGKIPIADRIHDVTGLPVFLDNDVNARALAEHRYGAYRDAASLVVLALGSGPGGAVILNGQLVRGRHGYAGEFGHVTVMPDGPVCICGSRGCGSVYVSAEMMVSQARERAREHPGSKLLALAGGDPAAITSHTVFAAARDGDVVAGALVDRACEALAAMLGTILNGLDPDVIVVTGGMGNALAPMERDILRRAGKYAFARLLADTTIRFVTADKRETVRGGAALFLYETERRASRARPGRAGNRG